MSAASLADSSEDNLVESESSAAACAEASDETLVFKESSADASASSSFESLVSRELSASALATPAEASEEPRSENSVESSESSDKSVALMNETISANESLSDVEAFKIASTTTSS